MKEKMKVTLISWSSAQRDALAQIIKKQGYDIVQSSIREEVQSLQKLLEDVRGNVLIVECSENFKKQDFEELAKFITEKPQTMVLMLSEKIDADTLVAAMQTGVREVLSSTPSDSELSAALKRLSQRKITSTSDVQSQAEIIAFLSCKGGSGATFLATNFAYILAEEMGKNTIFLDLDMQCGDAVYYVSPGTSKSDIIEITRQIERLDAKLLASSVLHVAPNFDLLPAPEAPDAAYSVEAPALKQLIDIVQHQYEMVVLDLERVIDPLTEQALDMADVVYVVMENLLPFVRDAKRIVAKCRALGYSDRKIRLVVNRYEKNGTIDVEQIEKAVGIKVSHTIRSSFQDVAQAINTGVPIIHVNPHNAIVDVLRTMTQECDPNPIKKQSTWISRLIGT